MVKKAAIVSAKLCNAQCIFCVQNNKHKQKIKFKSFLHQVEGSCISEVQNTTKPSSDELQWLETQPVPSRPKQEPPCRQFRDFSKHKPDKLLDGGEGKKYPARQCKGCKEHMEQSETTYICKFCIVTLHKGSCFEKYHSLKN
jgi:hypothetical protein